MKDSDRETLKPPASSSLWRPLRATVFRNLLVADVVSDIGTFMQSVGAAWLMVSLGAGPICRSHPNSLVTAILSSGASCRIGRRHL